MQLWMTRRFAVCCGRRLQSGKHAVLVGCAGHRMPLGIPVGTPPGVNGQVRGGNILVFGHPVSLGLGQPQQRLVVRISRKGSKNVQTPWKAPSLRTQHLVPDGACNQNVVLTVKSPPGSMRRRVYELLRYEGTT